MKENKHEYDQKIWRKRTRQESETEEAPDHTENSDTHDGQESVSEKRMRRDAQKESMSKEEKEKTSENEGR